MIIMQKLSMQDITRFAHPMNLVKYIRFTRDNSSTENCGNGFVDNQRVIKK